MDERAQRQALRAVGRAQRVTRGLGRWGLWGSILLFAGLYCGLAVLAYCCYDIVKSDLRVSAEEFFGPLSVVAMTLVPAWASLLVLLSCATAFPQERAAGTLEALRLAPLPTPALQRALTRPRIRFGLTVLLIAAPFYLLPRGFPFVGSLDHPTIAHSLHVFTLGRGYFFLGLQDSMGFPISSASWCGLPGLTIDVTRLYAMAAIGTAVSLRARSISAAVFWAAVGGLVATGTSGSLRERRSCSPRREE